MENLYKSVVRELMGNDRNASWDEIYPEIKAEYSELNEEEIYRKGINEIKDTLEYMLNDDRYLSYEEMVFYGDIIKKINRNLCK